ncbi:MAG: hypothetical protein GYB20_07725 [Oceanospirillales bacterium]|nr:hypothetical protein [Oceanospirillales bacterium]MBR9887570.1 hypothetical protein [Oceanospirillales bacterium]
MGKVILLLVVGYFVYQYLSRDESGCDKYASKYSCDYVENKASYDVYYWHNVERGNANDEEIIGSALGLKSRKNFAVNYVKSIDSRWNRSYIYILKKDDVNMEKHRL